jgi:hypothetical protein
MKPILLSGPKPMSIKERELKNSATVTLTDINPAAAST